MTTKLAEALNPFIRVYRQRNMFLPAVKRAIEVEGINKHTLLAVRNLIAAHEQFIEQQTNQNSAKLDRSIRPVKQEVEDFNYGESKKIRGVNRS